jgi:hypothetical protein
MKEKKKELEPYHRTSERIRREVSDGNKKEEAHICTTIEIDLNGR